MPKHFEASHKLFESPGRNPNESDFQFNSRSGRLDSERLRDEGKDGGTDHDVEEGGVQPDKTNSRWLEMQKPRGSRPGLRETINLPLLRS